MWWRTAVYGLVLAVGTLGLQWLDYQRVVRAHAGDIYVFLIAAAFLAVGVLIGSRAFSRHAPVDFDGNPKARAGLHISASELVVLQALALGLSNKEIAARLDVSPNTIKTHVARLFDKLGAKRRTDAVNRARELGILA